MSEGWKGNGAPGEIRTPDLQLRRLPLYPAELRARQSSSVHAELYPINWWIETRRQAAGNYRRAVTLD